jgi:predicted negative regulator of RcsB-dependent stress response
MSASKIDHKELQRRLKEDELSLYVKEFIGNCKELFEKYGRAVTLSIALVIIIVFAIYFWGMKSSGDFVQSQILFGNATQLVQQEQYEGALQELNKLLNQYSGTEVAPFGLILRAKCFFKTEQYQQALEDYQKALPRLKRTDSIPVHLAIVQIQRSLGQPDAALDILNQLESEVSAPSLQAEILFMKGGCYEDSQDMEKALEMYRSIAKDSPWRDLAIERIDWIEAQAVPPINP